MRSSGTFGVPTFRESRFSGLGAYNQATILKIGVAGGHLQVHHRNEEDPGFVRGIQTRGLHDSCEERGFRVKTQLESAITS
jgi:hypothetical protein